MEDLNSLRDKILLYGAKHNVKALEDLCAGLDDEMTADLINQNFTHVKFKELLMFMLSSSVPQQTRRYLIVNTVISNLESSSAISTSEAYCLVSVLLHVISKFHVSLQVELLTHFLTSIQTHNETQAKSFACYKDFVPFLINEIAKNNNLINYKDRKVPSNEFQTTIVREICDYSWNDEQITVIASMFNDIQMNKEDHLYVLKKFGKTFRFFKCQHLPSLFLQLLIFCKRQHFRYVFFYFEEYFNYFKYRLNESIIVNMTTEALRSDEKYQQELNQVENSLFLYVYENVESNYAVFKDYLQTMKNFAKIPELVFSAFNLKFLLVISCVEPPNNCISHDILRTALVKLFQEQSKCRKSYNLNQNLLLDQNYIASVESIFTGIINNESNEFEFIFQGLLNFGLLLLDLRYNQAFGHDILIGKQYRLGMELVSMILKKRRSLADEVLKYLLNKISSKTPQVIECIRKLCRSNVMMMIEQHELLIESIKVMINKDYELTYSLMQAIVPVAERCPSIRDTLIVVVRKLMLSERFSIKDISLIKILKLLKNIRTRNLLQISQSSTSSLSLTLMSQMNSQFDCSVRLTLSFQNNEAVVLEVLKVLNQCFKHHSNVRLNLYEGLIYISKLNDELAVLVLGMFWSHFITFLNSNFQLLFEKSIRLNSSGTDIIDYEPLGNLILVMVNIITNTPFENQTKRKMEKTFEVIEEQIINKTTKSFDSIDFAVSDYANNEKIITLINYITILESLIAYRVLKWINKLEMVYSSDNFLTLLHKYLHFLNFYENKLMKKKDRNTKKTKNVQKDPEDWNLMLKLPKTILNLSTVEKIYSSVFGKRLSRTATIESSSSDQSENENRAGNQNVESKIAFLGTNDEFMRYFLNAAYQIVAMQKIQINKRKENLRLLVRIARITFQLLCSEFNDLLESNFTELILLMDIFYNCLHTIIQQYPNRVLEAVEKICASADKTFMIGKMQTLFDEFMTNDQNIDAESKKLPIVILNVIQLLCSQIDYVDNKEFYQSMLKWLDGFAERNTIENRAMVPVFLPFWFKVAEMNSDSCDFFLNIATNLLQSFGTIDQTEVAVRKSYRLIDEQTNALVLQELFETLKINFSNMIWLVSRYNMEYTAVTMSIYDRDLKRDILTKKEQDLSTQLCQFVLTMSMLINLNIKKGSLCGIIFKMVSNLYSLLKTITKYYTIQSSDDSIFENTKFDKVIRLVSKKLTSKVYAFIEAMYELDEDGECNENDKDASTKQTKRKRTTVPAKKRAKSVIGNLSIPKTVLLIEQFHKMVLKLAVKTKTDIHKDIRRSHCLAFRLKTTAVRESENMETSDQEISDSELSDLVGNANVSTRTARSSKRVVTTSCSSSGSSDSDNDDDGRVRTVVSDTATLVDATEVEDNDHIETDLANIVFESSCEDENINCNTRLNTIVERSDENNDFDLNDKENYPSWPRLSKKLKLEK